MHFCKKVRKQPLATISNHHANSWLEAIKTTTDIFIVLTATMHIFLVTHSHYPFRKTSLSHTNQLGKVKLEWSLSENVSKGRLCCWNALIRRQENASPSLLCTSTNSTAGYQQMLLEISSFWSNGLLVLRLFVLRKSFPRGLTFAEETSVSI